MGAVVFLNPWDMPSWRLRPWAVIAQRGRSAGIVLAATGLLSGCGNPFSVSPCVVNCAITVTNPAQPPAAPQTVLVEKGK